MSITALKLALEALEANQPINYCMNNNGEKFPMMQEDPFRFERNIKAITAIKEVLAQPEQELVAWLHTQGNFTEVCIRELDDDEIKRGWTQEPLYTTPPSNSMNSIKSSNTLDAQRTWVGLTDEEVITMSRYDLEYAALIGEVERKLKEKNS